MRCAAKECRCTRIIMSEDTENSRIRTYTQRTERHCMHYYASAHCSQSESMVYCCTGIYYMYEAVDPRREGWYDTAVQVLLTFVVESEVECRIYSAARTYKQPVVIIENIYVRLLCLLIFYEVPTTVPIWAMQPRPDRRRLAAVKAERIHI